MNRKIDQLLQNDSLTQVKELFNKEQKNKLIEDFMSDCFDENNCLTQNGYDILTKLRTIGNNEMVYKQISNSYKENIKFNLEEFRKTSQEEKNEKTDIINKGIEAEYSYIDQNKLGQTNEKQVNKAFDAKNLNTFSKMQLTDLYELCEGNAERKKDFVIALMSNDKNIYKNEYLAILVKDIKTQIPDFSKNIYASNGETPYNKIDEKQFFTSIWDKLSKIGHDIKGVLETGVWTISNIGDVVKKSFSDGEKKEKLLINDFNNKYEILSKDLETSTDEKTGFSGSIIQEKGTGNKTILIRGSDDWKDWLKNNIHIVARNKLPPQIESVVNFIEEAKAKGIIKQGEKINIVGHSLGGGLTQITSMMYKDIVNKAYTFNAPGVAGIETNIESEDEKVKAKVKEYKEKLEEYKKQKKANPDFEEDLILNIRNKDKVGNFDDKNHIGLKSGQVDGFSHFLDSLNSSIHEMNIEEFRYIFKIWFKSKGMIKK